MSDKEKAASISESAKTSSLDNEVPTLSQLDESPESLKHLERTVFKKLDLYILPTAALFYLLAFFDRTNVANARVAGMQKEIKITNYQYAVALTVTYVPYLAVEIPSNLLLRIVGPNLMLPTMVFLWGVVTIGQAFVKNLGGLIACRFFLGLLEGGLFPGLVLYLSYFYPRSKLNVRVSTFFASASLSGAFSGLLAAAIMNMDGLAGRPGWAWLFIIEGLATCVFGIASFAFFPKNLESVKFLSERERKFIHARLREEDPTRDGGKFSWREVIAAFKLPQTWLLAPPLFFCGTTLYGQAYFEPTVVAELGHEGIQAQLWSVPPFALAFVVNLVAAVMSDKWRSRGIVVMISAIIMLIGFLMFLLADVKDSNTRYASIFFTVTGTYLSAPSLLTWLSNNTAPHVRRATAIAFALILTSSGGILTTWLNGFLSPPPKYTKATSTFVAMSVGMFVFAVANTFYLISANRKKRAIRESTSREDESPHLGDQSAWYEYKL